MGFRLSDLWCVGDHDWRYHVRKDGSEYRICYFCDKYDNLD